MNKKTPVSSVKAAVNNIPGARPAKAVAPAIAAASDNAVNANGAGGLTVMLGLAYVFPRSYAASKLVIDEENSKQKITPAGWSKIIDTLPKETACVSFSCGAARSMDYLPGLIIRAHKQGFQTQIETRGELLTPDFVRKLKNSGLDLVAVNLDSPVAETRSETEGDWKTAIAGIKNCVREALPCAIYAQATKANIKSGGLKKIIRLAETQDVNYVWILPPEPAASLPELVKQAFNGKERKLLGSLVKKGFTYLEDEQCVATGKKLAYIFPNGDVTPCECVPFSFGNVRKTPLGSILKKMWKHPMCGISTKECLMYNKEFRTKYLRGIDLSRYFPVSCD